jgi:hypothetical protein
MIDTSWEGKVQFYELAFGTWIAYLFLVFIWKKLFKVEHDGWRYALITLIGGSFYIVNHYFLRAPFYDVLINSYTSIFLLLYYLILVKPLKIPLIKKSAFFLSSIFFTLIYIMAENLARFLREGRLLRGVYVPEFFFLFISFIACTLIILSHRRRH